MSDKLTREELAALEVGQTTISRSLSVCIVCCFILLIVAVPLLQTVVNLQDSNKESLVFSLRTLAGSASGKSNQLEKQLTLWQRNNQLLARMDSFEQQLEESSFLRSLLLAPGQRLLLRLGYGNEKVYPGQQDWLFYRPDMDYLMGPPFLDPAILSKRQAGGKVWEKKIQPDPVQAIVSFKQQLAERNIKLILVPTPIKASLHPGKFAKGSWHPPLQNRSWQQFLEKMDQAGVLVFDPAPVLQQLQAKHTAPLYLHTDTHWRPEAMEVVAKQLASVVQQTASYSGRPAGYSRRERTLESKGDIDAMLRLPEHWDVYGSESVTLHPVLTKADELWQPASDAEVLLLGDSFSNIYSLAGMGWGEGAGLGEQLSYFLDQPVDVLLQNDAGAFTTRELLSRELARGRDRLARKKVVVWQFAARELSSGDWKELAMTLGAPQESSFYVPPPGGEQKVIAVVAAVSSSPQPGSVPYKDNIITLHLVDIRNGETGEEYGQALVYGWGMRDNTLTNLARVRVGEQIELKLVDWDTVQGNYSSYRRSTLSDEMLELELPTWGEL